MKELAKKWWGIWAYIINSDERYIFWTTLIYYAVSTANLNNKTIFISLLALWVIYNFRLKNIRQSLLLTGVTSIVFLVGKTWVVELISPLLLRSSDFPSGYIAFIVITPLQILMSLFLIVIARDIIIHHSDIRTRLARVFSNDSIIALSLFFLWQLVSALLPDRRFELPLVYALQSASFFLLFIGLLVYLPMRFSSAAKILSLLGAMTVFQTALAGMQWLRRSTLGLAIEPTNEILTYLRGPGQGFFSVRAVGTFSHPNELAIFSACMALLFFPLLYLKNSRTSLNKTYYLGCFIAAFISLILSLGRSAWISFALCLMIFLFIVEKKWDLHTIRLESGWRKRAVYLFVLILIFAPMIISRAVESANLFKPTGGGETRLRLLEESIHAIKQKPIFGSGMGLSGYEMFKYHPEGIISTFPSVVHNMYLLIANESGLPALITFLAFLVLMARDVIEKIDRLQQSRKLMVLGSLMSLLSFLVNGILNQIFLMGIFLTITGVLLMTAGQQKPQEWTR